MLSLKLKLTEMFYSLQGETSSVGYPTVFIRLTGCPLRCQYCDTTYSFSGGNNFTIQDIINYIKNYNTRYITVTGGEPLAQKNCLNLLTVLCDLGYIVSLETGGSLDISNVDSRVRRIVDIKTPDSLESGKNYWENLDYLQPVDELKFVICSRSDYDWSKQVLADYDLINKVPIIFSPSFEQIDIKSLANWILEDRLNIRLQMQLHKLLNLK